MAIELDPLTGLPKQKKSAADGGLDLSSLGAIGGLINGAPGGGFDFSAPTIGTQSGTIKTPGFQFKSLADLLGNPQAFQDLISNDPTYKQTIGDLGNQGVTDAASRDAAIRRGLLQFGQVPDFTGQQFAGLTPESLGDIANADTRSAADKYTGLGWSTLGQLNTAHDRQAQDLGQAFQENKLNLSNSLGARQATNSGEAIYQNQKLQDAFNTAKQRSDQDFNGAKFSATQQLLDYIAGQQAGYLQQENARKAAQRQAAEDAANRLAALLGQILPPTDSSAGGAGGDAGSAGGAHDTSGGEPQLGSIPQAVLNYSNYLGGGTPQMPVGGPTLYRPAPPKPKLNLRYSGNRIG